MQRHFVLVLILAFLAAGAASAQAPRHDQITVVPVPGRVTLDGDLGEWDLSGAIESWFADALKPRYTVKLAFMYDTEALYLGAMFTDDTPLMNMHNPAVEPDRGWAGDCLQVRLCSDPAAPYPLPGNVAATNERVCHLTMWYYTPEQLPVLQISYGMDYHGSRVWTGAESGLAFRAWPDGQGWTLEGRIPWDRLNATQNPPRAGDRLALVAQPLWGDATGWSHAQTFNDVIRQVGFSFQGTEMWGQAVFSERGRLAPTERVETTAERQLPLELSLPMPDREAEALSVAVYDGNGRLMRSLLAGAAAAELTQSRGRVQIRWDGLDDDGVPLPPGEYHTKMLTHRGIGQQWVASLHNAGNPPWRTDDGTGSWGGDHGPPLAAACDDERVYLGWTVSEAGWSMIALRRDLTPDGRPQKLWGQHQVLEIGIEVTALASDGRYLYVAQDGKGWGAFGEPTNTAGVVRWDAATGRPENFAFGKRALVLSEWPDSDKPPAVPLWERYARKQFGPEDTRLNLLGLAVSGNTLYASLHVEDKVVAHSLETGEKIREFPLPRPAGLALAPDGSLVAVSEKRIVRINPESGEITPLVTGLAGPYGLAADAQGNLYVSDRGDSMQVKIYSPQGQPQGVIGRPGGRPWLGRYDAQGLLQPAGLTVDSAGKIWVTEMDNSPRRVSVWDRRGSLLADLHGPGAYAVMSAADLENPRRINVHATLYEVDYETGASQCLATLVRPHLLGRQIAPDFGSGQGRELQFRHHGGRTYLIDRGRGAWTICLLDEETLIAHPVAAMGGGYGVHLGTAETWATDEILDLLSPENRALATGPDGRQRGNHDFFFQWTDLNGDRLYQPEELVLTEVPKLQYPSRPGLYWGGWIMDDLTIWDATPYHRGWIWRLPVQEVLPHGAPLYTQLSDLAPVFTAEGKDTLSSIMPDGRGSVYLLEQKGGDHYGGGDWRALSRYDESGSRLWSYRNIWLGFGLESPLFQPGHVIGAMKFIGQAEVPVTGRAPMNLVAVNGYFGQFNVLSEDGLWVTALCKDNRYGPQADASTVWPENFSGFFFRNREDGRVYLMAGDTDARLWRLEGLDTLRWGEAAFRFTAADQQKALQALAAQQTTTAAGKQMALRRPAQPPVVDGSLADWDMGSAVEIDAGAGRRAQVALAWDSERLYAAFQVADDSPLRNAGNDFALLFKSGDTCEVMLAANPHADPDRSRPAPGDLRLLFSEMEGQPVAVLYMPVSPQQKEPRSFTSPTGGEQFDYVALLPEAEVQITRDQQGYVLEASVPLAALGFAPQPGMVTRADVGVLFSDAGGRQTVARAYWANRSPEVAITNDIPTEARLQPQHWGILLVE